MMSIIAALFLSTHFDLICNEIEHPDYNVLSKVIYIHLDSLHI